MIMAEEYEIKILFSLLSNKLLIKVYILDDTSTDVSAIACRGVF